MNTTAPAVKAALEAALKPRLDPTPVYRGAPPASAPDSLVIVGSTRGTQEFRGLGALSKAETYTVDVVFQAATTVEGQDGATAAAYLALGKLEDALREDPTLGGACQVAHVSAWEDDESPAAEGWLCTVLATVHVRARI